ncbi:MAG: hypothetical protein SFX18_10770 [Pirellulales bacterium]|nr:hypothetical protein [Pirellulales bacterium]
MPIFFHRCYAARLIVTVVAYLFTDLTVIASEQSPQAKLALAPLQTLVGEWKGVGLPKRGSNVGAWGETAACAWSFTPDQTALRLELTDGKYFSQLLITPGEKPDQFMIAGTLPDGKTIEDYAATRDKEGTLVLLRKTAEQPTTTAAQPPDQPQKQPADNPPPTDRPARITIKTLAEGDRLVVLYERAAGKQFSRLAEVGLTRLGGNFAKGAAGPECIVTGGLGTIEVSYQGKTYFVCCTGCKEAFEEDPAGIIAEYLAKKKK